MKSEVVKLGSSLSVPCVQELAKKPSTKIPPRYVRTDDDPVVLSDTISLPQVPVIDMQNLLSGELINHGVSSALVEKAKSEIQEFFNLPMEEKKKFWQKPDDVEGFGQAFVVSEEQKLNWGDMFYMVTLPTHLRKPHLFPKLPLPLSLASLARVSRLT
ncbi:hypothetical protein DITRI_Ditri10aG0159900 [Diplodiscus trichospermus]